MDPGVNTGKKDSTDVHRKQNRKQGLPLPAYLFPSRTDKAKQNSWQEKVICTVSALGPCKENGDEFEANRQQFNILS